MKKLRTLIGTALLIAMPALMKLAGATPEPPMKIRARLTQGIRHRPGREEFVRGRLQTVVASHGGADALIVVPKAAGDLEAGCMVDVLPLASLLRP